MRALPPLKFVRFETTHECPPIGESVTPCCGKTPFELPSTDRMTTEAHNVTCGIEVAAIFTVASGETGTDG